ncbi:serine hydrolase [Brevundimonas sp. G8]|uniref:serine hydrolase domain-containing protein n=1 Tax=Brevundimonas sp. G8 TaxID=1350776 RepID=UPI0012F0EEF7|nr:serine hydrolase domain-containing protein [Brevundimonas sp. G8]VXB66444.1 Beta-lactamase class C and other penicillin binding proteins [Brevundimonas sp. G8]
MDEFAGFSVASRPEDLGFDSARLKRLDDYMAGMVEAGRVAGVSTLVLRHGQVAAFRTHGKPTLDEEAALAPDALFRIYSMTKPIAAVAMMILFEEGRWTLDDPVTKFIPEFAGLKVCTGVGADGEMVLEDAKRPPTMREVMSHTAGFAYGLFDFHPVERAYRAAQVLQAEGDQDFIDRIAALPLMFQPGGEWFYSVASGLLGVIVSRISGQTFGDFLQERLFGPLGMTDTAFEARSDNADRLVTFYEDDMQGGLREVKSVLDAPINSFKAPPRLQDGGGGLVSTAADYARFCQMILNKGELDGVRILAPVTVELMATNVIPDAVLAVSNPMRLLPFNPAFGFGLGFSVFHDPRRMGSVEGQGTLAWGGMGGTWFWIDPQNDLVFVGLIQRLADPISSEFRAKARTLTYAALTRPEF